MRLYLSDQRTWVECTEGVRQLADKSITVIEQARRRPAKIRIQEADPDGPDAGKCTVVIWHASISPANPQWTSGEIPPVSQAHNWQVYLTEDGIAAVQRKDEDGGDDDLLLEVPEV